MIPRAIHQILPFFAYGDAIGNQVLELRDYFIKLGYRSEIFAENWDRRLGQSCHHYQEYEQFSHPDNLLILHYSTGGKVNQYVRTLADRVVLYYHNITPAHFFYWVNGQLAHELEEAQQGLASLGAALPVIVASPYNAQELRALGFHVLGIAPYILRLEQLDQGLAGQGAAQILKRYSNPTSFDWLSVGRLVPNKCIEDIIRSFYYFHKWITPESRLFLVGSGAGAEAYVKELEGLTNALALDDSVVFAGHYGAAEGLGAFYRMADLYLCMSEHEGFNIPLIEAMYFKVPVMAFASTAVPLTLGQAGILVEQKNYPLIAEIACEVKGNDEFRERLLKGQAARASDFAPDVARSQVYDCLKTVMEN